MADPTDMPIRNTLQRLAALLGASLELWEIEGDVTLSDGRIIVRLGVNAVCVRHERDNPVAAWWVTHECISPAAGLRECPCSGCLGVLDKVREFAHLGGRAA